MLHVGQIPFVEHHRRLYAVLLRHRDHFINDQGIGVRPGGGGHDHQAIQIGHRRADQRITAGQDLHQKTGAVLLHLHLYPVPRQGGDPLPTEPAAGPAVHQAAAEIHRI